MQNLSTFLFILCIVTGCGSGHGIDKEFLKERLTDLSENDKESEFFSNLSTKNLTNQLSEGESQRISLTSTHGSARRFGLDVDTFFVVSRERMKQAELREIMVKFINNQLESDKSTTLIGSGTQGSLADSEHSIYSFHYKQGDRRYGVITITTVEAGEFSVATVNKAETMIMEDFFRDLISAASDAK